MKKYCFYALQDDFCNLFDGENLNAFLELYFRKDESNYFNKQFELFVRKVDFKLIDSILKKSFCVRKDFVAEGSKYVLDNFITSNKEVLRLKDHCIEVETDYEISPFINVLSDNFPDLIGIDVNNYKIDRIGLVSSLQIR